ncbi:nucleotidyltransferase domain-containing protein [Candidatus Parcubacteria bacterium]|nr:nucleotidyltransferase domain-containing protein [Candidatus Parcubacteria bacterium]
MKLENYPVKKLKKQILSVVGKHLDLNDYRIFFFGSRVKGDNFDRADIDFGVEGLKKISPSIKFKIQEELENLPILYKIDFVDFKNVSKEFKQEALKNIEYVK